MSVFRTPCVTKLIFQNIVIKYGILTSKNDVFHHPSEKLILLTQNVDKFLYNYTHIYARAHVYTHNSSTCTLKCATHT